MAILTKLYSNEEILQQNQLLLTIKFFRIQ